MPSACAAARIVHATPSRLRVRLPALDLQCCDHRALEAALRAVRGVHAVRVNAGAGSVIVEHAVCARVRGAVFRRLAGLRAQRRPPPADAAREPPPLRLAFSALAAAVAYLGAGPLSAALVLASIAPTLGRGVQTLLTRGIKVQVLDALSLGVAALRREYATAAAAQFLLELAAYIESTSARRSDELIERLMRPNPTTVMVERGAQIVRAPFASLILGERVHVNAGELVPVDGAIVAGAATVNQSSVTGESLPIPKEVGDAVLSGTVLEEGRLVIAALRVGDGTTTARIARFIREALARRGGTQRLAERLADRRVWISLGFGAAVYALTRDARRLESLFLVDYSCALKLGAAVAVKSALYRGARAGVLIKGGEALERLAEIDTVVFDKTGTLSHGALEVTDILTLRAQEWPRERLLATIASVAEHSTHPVAAAVTALAHASGLAHMGHEEVDFVVGHGLRTRVAAGLLHIGSRHYLVDHERVGFARHEGLLAALEAEGKTLLHVALDGEALGVIALRDRVRAESAATLRRLRELGVHRLIMLTGDRGEVARQLAAGLDLDEVHYEVDPEGKATLLQALKTGGARVAFVGDGVNDGPALMTAHLGIAMPAAADIARASADVVLLEERLDAIADALALARDTLAGMRRTFATAVGVNTGIMAGASLGWLPPILSSLMHNGTTIALLLRAAVGGGPQRTLALPAVPGAHT